MTAREQILTAVRANQPDLTALPITLGQSNNAVDLQNTFVEVLTAIGGKVITTTSYDKVIEHIRSVTTAEHRITSTIEDLAQVINHKDDSTLPHSLQNTELAVIKAHFGVAENGAVWVTEDLLSERVLPFITQHLIVILNAHSIVVNMHKAYETIGADQYGYGTFIAGPSKTADIEQSLVLGAHGSRSMTIFLIS